MSSKVSIFLKTGSTEAAPCGAVGVWPSSARVRSRLGCKPRGPRSDPVSLGASGLSLCTRGALTVTEERWSRGGAASAGKELRVSQRFPVEASSQDGGARHHSAWGRHSTGPDPMHDCRNV